MCKWCSIHKAQCIFSYFHIDRIKFLNFNILNFSHQAFVLHLISLMKVNSCWSVEHNTSKYRLEKWQFSIGSYGTHSVLDTPRSLNKYCVIRNCGVPYRMIDLPMGFINGEWLLIWSFVLLLWHYCVVSLVACSVYISWPLHYLSHDNFVQMISLSRTTVYRWIVKLLGNENGMLSNLLA